MRYKFFWKIFGKSFWQKVFACSGKDHNFANVLFTKISLL